MRQVGAAGWHVMVHVEVLPLERPLCSADGGGPADGDEGFIDLETILVLTILLT